MHTLVYIKKWKSCQDLLLYWVKDESTCIWGKQQYLNKYKGLNSALYNTEQKQAQHKMYNSCST